MRNKPVVGKQISKWRNTYFVTYLSTQRELNILYVKYSLYSPYDDDVIIQDGASSGTPFTYTYTHKVSTALMGIDGDAVESPAADRSWRLTTKYDWMRRDASSLNVTRRRLDAVTSCSSNSIHHLRIRLANIELNLSTILQHRYAYSRDVKKNVPEKK